MVHEHQARVAGSDEVSYDDEVESVTYKKSGAVLWTGKGELIATYAPETHTFHWSRPEQTPATEARRVEAIFHKGRANAISQLTVDVLHLDGPEDADMIANLGAHLAGADGVLRLQGRPEWTFLALFDLGERRKSSRYDYSVPPPLDPHDQPHAISVPALLPVRSLAPPSAPSAPSATALAPAPATPAIREPSRDVFLPVARAALADVANAMASGFRQALLVVTIDASGQKARYFVQLVTSDPNGDLQALEPSSQLLDATGKFIAADAHEGNGRWRRLVARLATSARGASVGIEVK
jgi:hypothetical protein